MHDNLVRSLASCLILPYMWHVQKHSNQLQALADAALQLHTEHNYDNKVCMYVTMYVCMSRRGERHDRQRHK